LINWKEEYKKQNRFLIGITIILAIALILFLIGLRGITQKMNKKDDKIWQQEMEIVDLKEQMHNLEREKQYEGV
jgi:cell division protein FtsL